MTEDLERKVTGKGILEAYASFNDTEIKYMAVGAIAACFMIGIGIDKENVSSTLAGVSVLSLVPIKILGKYVVGYFEARLDYMQNGRFTKLDEDKK